MKPIPPNRETILLKDGAPGSGDYTAERQQQPQESMEQIAVRIAALKAERGGSLAPKGAKIVGGD